MDPARCISWAFGADLWDVQADICTTVAAAKKTAVKACHSSSKTFTAARLALWWLLRYPDGVVVTTSSSWTQVERILWGEIRDAWEHRRISLPEPNKTELSLGPKNYAVGISTNLGVRFRGFHSGNVLIIIDEPQGIMADVWVEIDGIAAGGNVHVLAIGNPTVPGGPFHDAFTVDRAFWKTITIGAFDTPNLVKYRGRGASDATAIKRLLKADEEERATNPRPYLIGREWVAEKAQTWGTDNRRFISRVMGRFPDQVEGALMNLRWLEDARMRPSKVLARRGKMRAGIDVAGGGESETVLYIVQGNNIVHLQTWSDPDVRGRVIQALAHYKEELELVNVDATGIGHYLGKDLAILAKSWPGVQVNEVMVGEPSRQKERFENLRAELMFGLRDRLEDGQVNGLTDETTIAQLTTIREKPGRWGRDAIEKKEDAASRGVKSPDRAEALMLAFAGKVPKKGKKRLRAIIAVRGG